MENERGGTGGRSVKDEDTEAEQQRMNRRDVLCSSTKVLGALYLAPATVSLLTADRATAQSVHFCAASKVQQINNRSGGVAVVRYMTPAGNWTDITLPTNGRDTVEMCVPQTCRITHYCSAVEYVYISTVPGTTLELRNQCVSSVRFIEKSSEI